MSGTAATYDIARTLDRSPEEAQPRVREALSDEGFVAPVASMQAVDNAALRPIAEAVGQRLRRVIDAGEVRTTLRGIHTNSTRRTP